MILLKKQCCQHSGCVKTMTIQYHVITVAAGHFPCNLRFPVSSNSFLT